MKYESVNNVSPRGSTRLSFSFFIFLISCFIFPTSLLASTTHTVLILQHRFEPDSVSVMPGDTVRWLQQDATAHTVTGTGAEIWDSENMTFGDVYVRVFNASGTFDYVCLYHPMSGKVMVGGPSPIRPAARDPLPTKLTPAPGAARDARGRRLAREPSRHEAVIRRIPPQ